MKKNENETEDPRRARVLEKAIEVFLAYGFSRTTMDDIARAVEISRPALYLLFRNKADIFRAVVQELSEQSRRSACETLREGGELGVRLTKALDRALFHLLREVESSPHGDELLDVNSNIAADVISDWRQSLVSCFAKSIAEEAKGRGVRLEDCGLSAAGLAEMLFNILDGLKARGVLFDNFEETTRQFVALVELALKHGDPQPGHLPRRGRTV